MDELEPLLRSIEGTTLATKASRPGVDFCDPLSRTQADGTGYGDPQKVSYTTGNSDQRRVVTAFARPPGSGKTTIAEVVRLISTVAERPIATCLPMDSFRYTPAYLGTLPNCAKAHARRDAAWAFDAAGVVALTKTLSESRHRSDPVRILAPSLNHSTKNPVADSISIGA
ncbi:hypothetical protein F5Y16DRAFT_398739 [Xylariaceae sp. FL0255]|nr:hypothetical protein F5Y16DRAFT_398739 [Xylariaceae sp. FL0255]